MPGRNAKDAHRAFLEPLVQSLGCITWERLRLDDKPIAVGVPKGVSLGGPGAPVALNGELADGSTPAIFMGIEYSIVEDPESPAAARFRVHTEKYTYHLYSSLHEEVLLYHWHPDTSNERPHLHVGKQQLAANPAMSAGAHIPTARVALESVVLFVIEELGVRPIHATYREIIGPHLQNFVAHRNWHHEPPARPRID